MIEAKKITKIYRIPHEKPGTLFETILGKDKRKTFESFSALQNVSFKTEGGEMIGLIGKNGSGKTTLLKILGGIIAPTSGTCFVSGHVAPFLGLGIGFHYELSAEENLFLYGAILGMDREEIREKLEAILRFAGVERFKDMKLKHFSSGMTNRLAFSLMSQTNFDVLLLDEIFAVGDKDFIPQSLAVLEKYKDSGKTVVIASHNTDLIARYCPRTLLLEKGVLKAFGKTEEVVREYNSL